jgi:MarR-like DNA-binding transcriptional regulator SgrR of sgrS sRNA
MKRFVSALLALVSACPGARVLDAARPRYGGTLRVATAAVIRRLDPSLQPSDSSERWARERVLPLIFEGLTSIDSERGLEPRLAASWQAEAGFQRWRLRIANGITFHDGSLLQAAHVAASLQAAERDWKIGADQDTLLIELPQPVPDLPWLLADMRHAIAIRNSTGDLVGTGPFRLERVAETQLSLRAHDGYRKGRPFLDGVTVQMGQPLPAQIADLEAGRVDFVSLLPTDSRRLAQRGLQVFESKPLELMALVFEPHRSGAEFEHLRAAVAAAVDRTQLANVLLQHHAEPAETLIPRWLSGYRFPSRAGTARPPVPPADQRRLVLRVDALDTLAHAAGERIIVDLREAGFTATLQTPTGLAPRPDMRLLRIRIPASSPDRALAELLAAVGAAASRDAGVDALAAAPLEVVYRVESRLLERPVIVPLVHLPELYAVAPEVATWQTRAVLGSGVWALDDLWLATNRP